MLPRRARVAEEIAIGDITTGASNDIERATKLAKQMVTRFGMSEKLGPQTFGEANHEVFLGRDFSANADYSPEVAYEIDKEVSRLIDEAYEKARTILTERRATARPDGRRAHRARDHRQGRARGAAQRTRGTISSPTSRRATKTATQVPLRRSRRPRSRSSLRSRPILPWHPALRLYSAPSERDEATWIARRSKPASA